MKKQEACDDDSGGYSKSSTQFKRVLAFHMTDPISYLPFLQFKTLICNNVKNVRPKCTTVLSVVKSHARLSYTIGKKRSWPDF